MAYIVGLHGQLAAEAAVYEYQQLHFFRPAKVQKSIHGRAYGAAGMQHVVYQHHVLTFYAEGYIGNIGHLLVIGMHIVAVEGDIQLTIVYGPAGYLLYGAGNTVGQVDTARLYAYNNSILKRKVVLYQLVRQPLQRYMELRIIEQGLHKKLYLRPKIKKMVQETATNIGRQLCACPDI